MREEAEISEPNTNTAAVLELEVERRSRARLEREMESVKLAATDAKDGASCLLSFPSVISRLLFSQEIADSIASTAATVDNSKGA